MTALSPRMDRAPRLCTPSAGPDRCADLSVVIPLHDKAPFIARTLASIEAQRPAPAEVVVIDDGSNDESAALVAHIAARSPLTIRLIRQDNRGVSAARNAGMRAARRDWIAFLDADDAYLPGALAAFERARRAVPGAEVIFGEVCHAGQDTSPATALSEAPVLFLSDYFAHLVGGGPEITASAVMIRRGALIRAGGFPEGVTVGEDSDTWFRLGCEARFAYLPAPVARYHIEDGASGWRAHQGEVPHWHQTFADWIARGRIALPRRRSAARFHAYSCLHAVIWQANAGHRDLALARLAQVDWQVAPKALWVKAMVISLAPWLLRAWLRLKPRRAAR